jgi:putative lipase involved disintegration of autophagic bodies
MDKNAISLKKLMTLNNLTETINKTYLRTIKFNDDGSLGHTLDRSVLKVVAIAIASDILDEYVDSQDID